MNWNKIAQIVRNEKTWTIIAVFSGTVASISALLIVLNLMATWKEQIESNRPYFTITKRSIIQLPQSPQYHLQFIIENIGVRPAYDLYGKIFIIDKNVLGKPNYSFDFSIADVIPANAPIPWNSDTLLLPRNLPAQYIVLAIEYSDPIAKKILDQIFYMKWNGVIEDKPDSNFVYVSMKEKMKIVNRINVTFQDFE